MEARLLRGLSIAVVGVLLLALVGGLFLPVYTDEIGWRFQERAGFDGVDKLFSEVCGPKTLARPLWFMMPARWYSAVFNGAFPDPLWIRLSGILYAVAEVALIVSLIRRVAADRQDRAILAIIGIGLLAIGTMPLLMVWSRPEQPIILAALGALRLAFADGAAGPLPPSTARQAWARSLGIWALGCIAVSYHVKGLFLLPLMLACLFFASRGRAALVPRVAMAAVVVATMLQAAAHWRERLACPDNPTLKHLFDSNNMAGLVAEVSSFDQAVTLAGRLIANLDAVELVRIVGPRIDPMSSWLEAGQVDGAASLHWFLALFAAWAVALVPAVIAAVVGTLRGLRERRLNPQGLLALVAVGVVLAWTAMQPVHNVYEAPFVVPLLVVAIVLGWSSCLGGRVRSALGLVAAPIGLFALVSPFALASVYGPSLARAARQEGTVAAQPLSMSVFGYATLRPQIRAAARQCRIDPDRAQAPLVDDVTYLAMMRSRLPQHRLSVLGGAISSDAMADPIGYLESRRSDGIVVGCRYLDGAMRARAKRVGEFCCLAPPNW